MNNLKKFIFILNKFDWDKGNREKNLIKHKVTTSECEEVFFNTPVIEEIPGNNKQGEQRYYALGITNKGKKLTIIFTVRNDKIRVISARSMSRRERKGHEQKAKKDTQIQRRR